MNTAELDIPVDHPAFAGHFPGRPMLPGALLLAEALQALVRAGVATRGRTVSNAKFLSPVAPGERVRLQWHETPSGALQLELAVGARRVASVVLAGEAR